MMGARNVKGMMLVELLVTVVILFLIAAVAIPSYRGYIASSRQQAMITQVAQFHAFEQNYRVDNGEYLAGVYDPKASTNTLSALGYRVDDDGKMFRFEVKPGAGCTLDRCYLLVITDGSQTGTWNSSLDTWTWVTEP